MADRGEYLGDGVYLGDDGWQLWLAVDDHENKVVALDYATFRDLMDRGLARFVAMGLAPANAARSA